MQNDKLDNYLRTYRKKLGLTQREVSFLLGCHGAAKVSRYERSGRIPDLKTINQVRHVKSGEEAFILEDPAGDC